MVDDPGDDEPTKKGWLRSCGGVGGVGVFLIAVLVASAVFLIKQTGSEAKSAERPSSANPTYAPNAPRAAPIPQRELPKFRGEHTRPLGRVADRGAGVSYAELGKPWRVPSQASKLGERGFTSQRYVVTEKQRSQVWYGQLMTGTLSDAQQNLYGGRGTERQATTALAQQFEDRFYTIAHKRRNIASQPLKVGPYAGWVVGFYVDYRQRGVKATGEVVAVAVVSTGRQRPAVLFMAVPNTHKKLWPDVNYVLSSLKVLPGAKPER